MDVLKFDAPADVAEYAAQEFVREASAAVDERGSFNVALSGGSTPKLLYRKLLEHHLEDVPWSDVHFFVSDERMVPIEDERSNIGLASTELLGAIGADDVRAFAVQTTVGSASEAADLYEATVRDLVPGDGVPRFDLVLLGLGSDRHIASLFPGMGTLLERERLVVPSAPGVLPPRVERVTFTLNLINAARRVLLLTTGPDKAEAVRDVLELMSRNVESIDCPAASLRPIGGRLTIALDIAAASFLV